MFLQNVHKMVDVIFIYLFWIIEFIYSEVFSYFRVNDLRLYGEVVRSDGPAMTWGMHAIGKTSKKNLNPGGGSLPWGFLKFGFKWYTVQTDTQFKKFNFIFIKKISITTLSKI